MGGALGCRLLLAVEQAAGVGGVAVFVAGVGGAGHHLHQGAEIAGGPPNACGFLDGAGGHAVGGVDEGVAVDDDLGNVEFGGAVFIAVVAAANDDPPGGRIVTEVGLLDAVCPNRIFKRVLEVHAAVGVGNEGGVLVGGVPVFIPGVHPAHKYLWIRGGEGGIGFLDGARRADLVDFCYEIISHDFKNNFVGPTLECCVGHRLQVFGVPCI